MENLTSYLVIESEKDINKQIETLTAPFGQSAECVGTTNDLETGIELIQKYKPEVVFLDIRIRDNKGRTLIERIKNQNFVILIIDNGAPYRLISKGDSDAGFIIKKIDLSEIFNC